jgi:hypothetical protein
MGSQTGEPRTSLKSQCLLWFVCCFRSCSVLAGTLESIEDAESHGNVGNRVARAGFFAYGSKPEGIFFAFDYAGTWARDFGIPAWHLVTELRKAYGPV